MFTAQTRYDFSRIVPFGILWVVFSLVYSMLERGLLGELTVYPSTGNPYNFAGTTIITALTALVCGLLVGTIEVKFLSRRFEHRRFAVKLLFKTLVYVLLITVFLFLVSLFFNAFALNRHIFSGAVIRNVLMFFTTFSFSSVVLYVGVAIVISLFYYEVNENLGRGVVTNFLYGKYHTPKEEERIFMFLDMKSSTTIAEQIGHKMYFKMLKQYFADLSGPIIRYSGEVYQYVGDEVVITWTLKNGVHNNQCIRCFFALKEVMGKRKDKYQSTFGVVPDFKAGLHTGKVTTGEVGGVKKEIIFTGDVLNTTSRIQSLCNSTGVDILVSGQLVNKMKLANEFEVRSLGETELRGRGEKVELLTVNLWRQ